MTRFDWMESSADRERAFELERAWRDDPQSSSLAKYWFFVEDVWIKQHPEEAPGYVEGRAEEGSKR